MIVNTGQRSDIPVFYSTWFMNRIKAGFVMVRNPFNPHRVTRYLLRPDAVDAICFCTKNPKPMIPRLKELHDFRQVWHVTITAYGEEIEPHVPPISEVVDSFRRLSDIVGSDHVFWRYDPIFLSSTYILQKHLDTFGRIAEALRGYTSGCIFSFIDLYSKTLRNRGQRPRQPSPLNPILPPFLSVFLCP